MVQYQSGGVEKWKPGGTDVRAALWLCKTAIVLNSCPKLAAIIQLRDYYERTHIEENGTVKHSDPGIRNQRIMRVVRRMLTMLFKDLVASLFESGVPTE